MRVWMALLGGLLLSLVVVSAAWLGWQQREDDRAPIVIGAVHALSGPLATSEAPLVAALRLAVHEINQSGGLLGRPVELHIEDTLSNARITGAAAAGRLIVEHGAVALFGCWSSGCRHAVRPVVESRKHLLFFPMAHEGMELSPNIIYTGPTANQQSLPATAWAMENFGLRVYLIGTDGLFPRRVNAMLHDFIGLKGGRVLGERYVPLAATRLDDAVAELRRLKPDVVLSTLSGDSNLAFFDALVAAGMAGQPVMAFTAAQPEMRAYGGGRLTRLFAAWGYLPSLPDRANQAFLARLRALHGQSAQVSDAAMSAYVGVLLWASAVREAGSAQTAKVNAAVLQQSVVAPHGFVAMDERSRHVWRPLRIAQVQPDGELRAVWEAPQPIRPSLWPAFRPRAHWDALVAGIAP